MAMKKVFKGLIIFCCVIVLLVVVIVGVVAYRLDSIVKVAVEKTMSHVLEVDVTLDSADVSLLGGEVGLNGLTVGNPAGFKTKSAFQFDEARVRVKIKSFKTDEPVIRLVSLSEPKLTLERGLRKSNLSELINSASRFGGEEDDPPEDEKADQETEDAARKKVKIDKVLVKDTTVALSAPILKGREVSYTLPQLEFNNLGGEDQDVTIAEGLRIFFTELLRQSIESGKGMGVIPEELLGQLEDSYNESVAKVRQEVDKVKENLLRKQDELKEKLKMEGGGLDDKLKGATEGLGKKLDEAGKSIKLPFGKKDE